MLAEASEAALSTSGSRKEPSPKKLQSSAVRAVGDALLKMSYYANDVSRARAAGMCSSERFEWNDALRFLDASGT